MQFVSHAFRCYQIVWYSHVQTVETCMDSNRRCHGDVAINAVWVALLVAATTLESVWHLHSGNSVPIDVLLPCHLWFVATLSQCQRSVSVAFSCSPLNWGQLTPIHKTYQWSIVHDSLPPLIGVPSPAKRYMWPAPAQIFARSPCLAKALAMTGATAYDNWLV